MSPTQCTHVNGKATTPSPLRIKKDSHFIRKPASPPSSASSSAASPTSSPAKPPHHRRQPLIIYTHSPKIIHTQPRDFMALVQKLTGQSPSASNSDHPLPDPKQEPSPPPEMNKNHHRIAEATSDDTDSSSVVTEENYSNTVVRNVHIESCLPPPQTTMTTAFYDPPPVNPCFSHLNIPFQDNSSDLFSMPAQPFYSNYHDSFVLMNSMRSSISSSSSSSTFEGMNEFQEF